MNSHPLVLIVDDEAPIRKFLRISLTAQHFDVVEAPSAADALRMLTAARKPDVVVLDLGLPDKDGKEVIEATRCITSVPIIVLSIRADENEKIAALDAGANDYVTKPFAIGELTARLRAALRNRPRAEAREPVLEAGSLRIDIERHKVFVDGAEVRLTPKEFALLALLMSHCGKVLTHRQLLREVWGERHQEDTQYLRVYIGQLRQKLGDDPADPRFIANEPGIGYRLVD